MEQSSDSNAPAAPAGPSEPRLLSDRVPTLRPDLNVVLKPNSSGLYDVGRRGSDKTFTLYDFEVSIARMLNGRRTVAELIDAAARIGIPVTLDSFQKFVRQLRAYDFVVDEEAAASAQADGGTWTPRAQWEPEVRELFQTALREFRKERYVEARGYVEALLQIQPTTSEAIDLLARIEERIEAGAAAPKLPTFVDLHDEPLAPPQPSVASSAAEATADSERTEDAGRYRACGGVADSVGEVEPAPQRASVLAELEPAPASQSAPPTASAEALPPSPPASSHELGQPIPPPHTTSEALKAVRRSRAPLAIAAGLAVVGIVGVAAVPVPCTVSAVAEVSPTQEAVEVKASRGGKIAKLLAQPGEWVEPGAALAELDDTALREEEIAIQRDLETLARQLEREQQRERSPAARKARAALARKEKELAKLTALRDRFAANERLTPKLKKAIAATEKKMKKKAAEVDKAKTAFARTSAADEISALQSRQQELQARLDGLTSARAELVIRSNSAGLFSAERRAGDPVEPEGVVGRVQDVRSLRARVAVAAAEAQRVSVGDAMTLTLGERSDAFVRTTVAALKQGQPLWTAEAALDNTTRTLPFKATGAAEIQCGSRAFVSRLLP